MVGMERESMVDPIYFVERECIICGEKIQVACLRSRLSLLKQDTDFCAYYKDINPYYYTVWTCHHCGYAARDTDFTSLAPAMIEKLRSFLSKRDVKVDFSGIRTREQAIVTYKLAIFYAEMIAAPASKLAGLHLRLGWLYRESEQAEEEHNALVKTRECYERALAKERMPLGTMSELTVMYLIADLFRRTGEKEKAMLYLSQVVSSPQAKLERKIGDLARELWQEMRATERA